MEFNFILYFYFLSIMNLLFGNLGFQEILIIGLVVLLLFGGKKIPELMRGLGQGVKSFKEGMNGTSETKEEEEKKEETKE